MRRTDEQRNHATPFLVLRRFPADQGAAPAGTALQPGMATFVLAQPATPAQDVGFRPQPGAEHVVSGAVFNRGAAPALTGFATLFVAFDDPRKGLPKDALAEPFDRVDFTAWPGQEARFRFRRRLVLPALGARRSIRMVAFLHVADWLADRDAPGDLLARDDRHVLRRDFSLQ